jgi:hypothetical protein
LTTNRERQGELTCEKVIRSRRLNSFTLSVRGVVPISTGLAEGLVPRPTVQTGLESAHRFGRYGAWKSTSTLPGSAITTEPSTALPRRRRRRPDDVAVDDKAFGDDRSLPSAGIRAHPTSTVSQCDAAPRGLRCLIWRLATSCGSTKCRTEPSERLSKAQITLEVNCFDCLVVLFLIEKTNKLRVMKYVFDLFNSAINQVSQNKLSE